MSTAPDITAAQLARMSPAEKEELLRLLEQRKQIQDRHRARTDLFFLLTDILNRPDIDRPWLKARCDEVQRQRNGYLDLWARDHYKSTLITFGLTIMEILGSHGDDPLPEYGGREMCFGIFSHTRPIAKGFLRQIKSEFEQNKRLQALFPDVLWSDTRKAPKWSEDDGIIVRRKSNPKEATVEAWGLVDGQPIGRHFPRMVYDDVVVPASVTTPEMMAKTTAAMELSYNLGTRGGVRRFIGTRYHFNDSYKTLMDRGTAEPRLYPATEDGSEDGTPVLLTPTELSEKRRDMGPYTFATQMLLNPKGDETQGFRNDWLRYYDGNASLGTNRYILVDPANEKKKGNDYTAIWCIGLGADNNYYVLDIVRDRLNLTQRCNLVMDMHRRWKPKETRYEKYGMMADIQHIEFLQNQQNYRFDITEVGGQTAKQDRIRRLIPLFEQGRVWLPRSMHKTNYEGTVEDLVQVFVEQEYKAFPVSVHDDMLDALARIDEPDLPVSWPKEGVAAANLRFETQFSRGSDTPAILLEW